MNFLKYPRSKPRFERVIVLIFLFAIQFSWLTLLVNNVLGNMRGIQIVLTIASLIMAIYLVSKDDNPAYRMSWILLITAFPVFGFLLYLMIGNKRPTRKMRKKISLQQKQHRYEMLNVPSAQALLEDMDPRLASLSRYITNVSEMPLYTNNQVTYFPNGETMMPDLIADLKAAKQTIFMEFFIVEYGLMYDQIMQVLEEKVREGVDVRLIYDDFGSITRLPGDYPNLMEAKGIKVLKFNPVKPFISMVYNTRDHRKYIIIDSEISYTGGLNIADEYINHIERFGYWKDNMIRLSGPATWNLTNLFLNMWNAFYPTEGSYVPFRNPELMTQTREMMADQLAVKATGFVQPFGDNPLDHEAVGENVYREILNNAVDYVYIYTPYLVISYELQTAMQLAAKRGVQIHLMTPGIPDKRMVFRLTRSFYFPLLKAGVKIFEFTPGFLHAKTFIADDKVATVGTINLDYRSLYLHFETNTVLYYHPEIEAIKADFIATQKEARQITRHNIHEGLLGLITDSVLRLLAPFV